MDLMKIATDLFLSQIGKSDLNQNLVMTALGALLGGDDGKLDLGDIVSQFQSGDLMSMAASWLGDGDNDSLDIGQLASVLGEEKIGAFASEIGVDSQTATSGLAGMIPELINQGSSGGSLLEMAGGALLKNLF